MSETTASATLKEITAESVSAVVSVLRVRPEDRLIFSVEVGNMPPQKIHEFMSSQKNIIKSAFPEDVKVLIVPMKNGVPTVELTVLKYEE